MKDALHWMLMHSPEGFAIGALVTFALYLKGLYPSLKNETEKAVRKMR